MAVDGDEPILIILAGSRWDGSAHGILGSVICIMRPAPGEGPPLTPNQAGRALNNGMVPRIAPSPAATIRDPVWFFKSLGVGPCAPAARGRWRREGTAFGGLSPVAGVVRPAARCR